MYGAEKNLRFCYLKNWLGRVSLRYRLTVRREWAHLPLEKMLGETKGWSRHKGEKKRPWLYQQSDPGRSPSNQVFHCLT